MAYPPVDCRFGEPRTMALLACVCSFQHLFAGLTNRSLREPIAGLIPGYTARRRPTTHGAKGSSSGSPASSDTS
jgi:hypothetical protein